MRTSYRTISILIGLIGFLIITPSSRTQTDVLPNQAIKTRLQPIVKGILARALHPKTCFIATCSRKREAPTGQARGIF